MLSHSNKILFVVFASIFFLALPVFSAESPQEPGYLIFCDPAVDPNDCDFNDLVELGVRIINFLIIMSTALVAISFVWAGFLYLTSAGDEGQAKKAKSIFTKAGIGFVVVLSAWLIVNTIVSALLLPGQGFTLIGF